MAVKNKRRILYSLALAAQMALVGAVFYLDHLTEKSAGVMHHIYYRKAQYEQTIFSTGNMNIHRAVLLALAGYFALSTARSLKKEKSKFWKTQRLLGILISGAALAITYAFADKIAYHYFIVIFEAVLAIQLLIVVLRDSKHI